MSKGRSRYVAAASIAAALIAHPATAKPSHDDEIKAFVTISAMAQTASDRCADILVSNEMLQGAPEFFHMAPQDEQAMLLAYGIEMKRLAAAIDTAPNLKAWCDAAYGAYGPQGDVVKGLLAR